MEPSRLVTWVCLHRLSGSTEMTLTRLLGRLNARVTIRMLRPLMSALEVHSVLMKCRSLLHLLEPGTQGGPLTWLTAMYTSTRDGCVCVRT